MQSSNNLSPSAGEQPPAGDAQEPAPEARQARRQWKMLALYLVLLALFGALAFWVHVYPVLGVDTVITHFFQQDRAPWFLDFMVVVSFLGNNALIFIVLTWGTVAVLALLRLRLEAVILFGITLTSAILNETIKDIVGRPRPSSTLVSVLQHPTGLSFPSGHVMSYMAYWGMLFCFAFLLLRERPRWRGLLLLISGLFVLLVGPSRIYLGDHWFSDVVGAYLFGALWLWLWLWLYFKGKEHGLLTGNRQM